jgi:hypothetical protein
MNPAALKVHIKELKKDGVLLLNSASFSALDLKKAKYEQDPRTDGTLSGWRVIGPLSQAGASAEGVRGQRRGGVDGPPASARPAVFVLPGIGRLVFQAISNRDLVVVRDVVMLLAAVVVLVNFVVDVLYAVVDPRLRRADA